MIGIDTNVLLRLTIGDDAAQANRARRLFDEIVLRQERVIVSPIVMTEYVWTLGRAYMLDRAKISSFLDALVLTPFLDFVDRPVILAAIADYRTGKADFADYMIAAYAEREGATFVFSFDTDAVKSGRFVAVP
jgi:predicted nucleic-acid-binding protein